MITDNIVFFYLWSQMCGLFSSTRTSMIRNKPRIWRW